MIRIAIALLAALSLSACHFVRAGTVVGSGVPAVSEHTLGNFNGIEASGSFRLLVRAGGEAHQVRVEGDHNIVELFRARLEGRTLRLSLPSGSYDMRIPLVVHVEAPSIARVEASGAIQVRAEDLRGEEFSASLSGASLLTAAGAVRKARFSGSGASHLDAFDLSADRVEVRFSGASRAEVSAATHLDVRASGASSVRYAGKPEVAAQTSGASSIAPR